MIRHIYCAFAIAACVASVSDPSFAQVPRITLAFESHTIEASPASVLSVIRIDSRGRTFFESSRGSLERLTLLDSSGAVVAQFAKAGRGPGEVTAPVPISVGPDGLMLWDAAQLRFSTWSIRGVQSSLGAPNSAIVPIVNSEKGVLAVRLEAGRPVPALVESATGKSRILLPSEHPVLTPTPVSGSSTPYAASFGVWRGGFVIARPGDYRLSFFDWEGKLAFEVSRSVSDASLSKWRIEERIAELRRRPVFGIDTSPAGLDRMRQTMSRNRLPGFSPASVVGLDGAGHVLVAGIEGDSAFVDVFSPPQYLGRISVPCLGFQSRWSVQGDWMAFVCQPRDESSPADLTIKVFRIVR